MMRLSPSTCTKEGVKKYMEAVVESRIRAI